MSLSSDLFLKAKALIPGGVNSPVRACLSVGADPLFMAKAFGATITDVDGQDYLDYVMSWGPMILGHAHPAVQAAAEQALAHGASFGAPCPAEVDLARAVVEAVPGIDMVRMVNSGTEATMSALRLARGFTGRDCLVKFEGCYHGHADAFLAAAGSGVATLAIPGAAGVTSQSVAHTLLAPYNDLEAVKNLFAKRGHEIAAVIVEPFAGNMGLVLPKPGFLPGLRELCDQYGALLIFDEVMTGFRLGLGGAQERLDLRPDLTTLGKILGGGFPVGAYGGRREIMEHVAPCGPVYQAGTLSGNPVAMAAGLAMLTELKNRDYPSLEAATADFAEELAAILRSKGHPVKLNRVGSIFTLYFTESEVVDFSTAKTADSARYAEFYRQMREHGVYLAPSGFECAFTSFAHGPAEYQATLQAAKAVKL